MIELLTVNDIQGMWTKIQELIDRTKRQTKQIQELQKQVKEHSRVYNLRKVVNPLEGEEISSPGQEKKK